MTIDLTTNTTQQFVKEESNRSSRRGGSREFHRWKAGANHLRFLTFKHVINRYDVLRGFVSEEHIGAEAEVLAVPVERVFLGDKPHMRMANCLPDRDDCPLWQNWFSPCDPTTGEPLSKEAAKQWRKKNKKAQPKPYFLANAIDTDNPEQGVHVIAFSRADWLGPRSNTNPPRQIAYGIFNALKGYDPGQPMDGAQPDNAIMTVASQSSLGEFAGFEKLLADQGMELFGPDGVDVIVHKRKGNFGLQLDTEAGISVRSKDECLTFPEKDFAPVDILMMPSAYPGYVSGRDSQPLSTTTKNFFEFVEQTKEANKTPANTESEAEKGVQKTQEAAKKVEAPKTPTTPQPAQEPSPAPQEEAQVTNSEEAEALADTLGAQYRAGKLVKSRKRKVKQDMVVLATDPDDVDEEWPEGVTYIGRVIEADEKEDEYTLVLEAGEQIAESADKRLQGYAEQGASEFYFPKAQLTILEEA